MYVWAYNVYVAHSVHYRSTSGLCVCVCVTCAEVLPPVLTLRFSWLLTSGAIKSGHFIAVDDFGFPAFRLFPPWMPSEFTTAFRSALAPRG